MNQMQKVESCGLLPAGISKKYSKFKQFVFIQFKTGNFPIIQYKFNALNCLDVSKIMLGR